jgi:hypothetical protein
VVEFVNPYTFVRQPLVVKRGAPPGHDRLQADRVCGALRVTVTAATPLLIRGFGTVACGDLVAEEGDGPVADLPRRADGTVIISGSSLMGAVRSVHEVLAGGCLRVLDGDYLPIHRHPASTAETRPVRLGVVTEVDGRGLPTRVTVAADTVWVPLRLLSASRDHPFRAGDRLSITDARIEMDNGRRVLADGTVRRHGGLSAQVDGSWVLLVTDTKVRDPRKGVYFAAGLVGSTARPYPVGQEAHALFGRCVDNANDVREYRRAHGRQDPVWVADAAPEYVPVCWPVEVRAGVSGPVVGFRLPARPFFRCGQPVWVRVGDGVVTELRLSQLWRFEGYGSVAQRVGDAGPCVHPDRLCPSCQLFGSVDPHGRDAGDVAAQSAYRGHVRIDEALAVGVVSGVPWHLAPLAAPRPSAGQFYLDNRGHGPADKNTRPTALWGSAADGGGLRPIRGRKFYWRTRAPDEPPRRGAAREHQSPELVGRVRLIPRGTRFSTRVSFDNLTGVQLGGLVAALDPRLLLSGDGREIVTSVGGGKPFGFGAVCVDVRIERLEGAGSRYLGQPPVRHDIAALVAGFGAGVDPQTMSELAAVLTLGAVSDDLVWYPPGSGVKGSESFDQGFDFWQRSAGVVMSREVRPLVSLPAPNKPQVLRSPPRANGAGNG